MSVGSTRDELLLSLTRHRRYREPGTQLRIILSPSMADAAGLEDGDIFEGVSVEVHEAARYDALVIDA